MRQGEGVRGEVGRVDCDGSDCWDERQREDERVDGRKGVGVGSWREEMYKQTKKQTNKKTGGGGEAREVTLE